MGLVKKIAVATVLVGIGYFLGRNPGCSQQLYSAVSDNVVPQVKKVADYGYNNIIKPKQPAAAPSQLENRVQQQYQNNEQN